MVARRSFVGGLAGASATGVPAAGQGQPPAGGTETEILPRSFGFVSPADDPEFGAAIQGRSAPTGGAVGTEPARHEEVATAFRLLLGATRRAPGDASGHLAAARYFEELRDTNRDGEPYNAEWRLRANPVVVGFFSLTNTLPSDGDHTQWCSAFVNFCLFAAGRRGTFSALSGSFRSFGDATNDPRPGDVAVFARHGESGRKGFGHVGFFDRRDGDAVWVLGGNQGGGASTGAVTTARFPVEGRAMALHSFRRAPGG